MTFHGIFMAFYLSIMTFLLYSTDCLSDNLNFLSHFDFSSHNYDYFNPIISAFILYFTFITLTFDFSANNDDFFSQYYNFDLIIKTFLTHNFSVYLIFYLLTYYLLLFTYYHDICSINLVISHLFFTGGF